MKIIIPCISLLILISCFSEPIKETDNLLDNNQEDITLNDYNLPNNDLSNALELESDDDENFDTLSEDSNSFEINEQVNSHPHISKSSILNRINLILKENSVREPHLVDTLRLINKEKNIYMYGNFRFSMNDVSINYVEKSIPGVIGSHRIYIDCLGSTECIYNVYNFDKLTGIGDALSNKESCLEFVKLIDSLNLL